MKKENQELRSKMLTQEQAEVVMDMIVNSMKDAYTDRGEMPVEAFYGAAQKVAAKIIKEAQMALIQINVFEKAVKGKKLKTKKK